MRVFIWLLSGWLALSPAYADGIFVAPTANGTAPIGQLPGTATNDAAAAGKVGELIEGSAALSSVSLTANTSANAGSIALTAGDWDVQCTIYYDLGATTAVSSLFASISATSNTRDLTIGKFSSLTFSALVLGNTTYISVSSPVSRVSLAGTTTHYCVAYSAFTASTNAAGGYIRGRRVR